MTAKRKRQRLIISKLINQVNFYFSEANVRTSPYLKKKLEDNALCLADIMEFNLIKEISNSDEKLVKLALGKCGLINFDENTNLIALNTNQENNVNADPEIINKKTVYIENLKPNPTIKSLKEEFSKFGTILLVTLPKFKNSAKLKGFAFIEFEKEKSANECCSFYSNASLKFHMLHEWLNSDEIKSKIASEDPKAKFISFGDIIALAQQDAEHGGQNIYETQYAVIPKTLWMSLRELYLSISSINKKHLKKRYSQQNPPISLNNFNRDQISKTFVIAINECSCEWFIELHLLKSLWNSEIENFELNWEEKKLIVFDQADQIKCENTTFQHFKLKSDETKSSQNFSLSPKPKHTKFDDEVDISC